MKIIYIYNLQWCYPQVGPPIQPPPPSLHPYLGFYQHLLSSGAGPTPHLPPFPPSSLPHPFPPHINPAMLFNPFLASAYAHIHSAAGQ